MVPNSRPHSRALQRRSSPWREDELSIRIRAWLQEALWLPVQLRIETRRTLLHRDRFATASPMPTVNSGRKYPPREELVD